MNVLVGKLFNSGMNFGEKSEHFRWRKGVFFCSDGNRICLVN